MAQFGITATPPETQATAPAIRTRRLYRQGRTSGTELRFASYLRGRNVSGYRDVLGSVTAGQSILPQAYSDVLQTARKIYAPFTQLATVQENVTLAGYKAAFVDDRANGLVILSADGGVSANEGDPVFASQLVNLDVTTSQEVRFSNQLAADSNFDLGRLLKTLCASRVGRGIQRLVTRGQDYTSSPATSTNQANLIANVQWEPLPRRWQIGFNMKTSSTCPATRFYLHARCRHHDQSENSSRVARTDGQCRTSIVAS